MIFCTRIVTSILIASVSLTAAANTIYEAGNIVVESNNTLYQYTVGGSLVSTETIPKNDTNETAREFTFLTDGKLAVYNGTFNPELSIYNGISWTSNTINGWSTVNNGSYGGIAAYGTELFLTDTYTGSGGEAKGLVQFGLTTQISQRFSDTTDYIDITLGGDNLLYALRNTYGDVDVIEPNTLEILRSVDLGHTSASRGVAADSGGNIYMVSWDGYIGHYDSQGALLNTLSIGGDLHDIDLRADGKIIIGSRFGQAYLTDASFSTYSEIVASSTNTFVAFVPVDIEAPELSGSHFKRGRDVTTTLTWTTEAASVDIYFNGEIIDTLSGTTTATYRYHKKSSQIFVVCNQGTLDCSAEYVAN